jgi:hypothetical protein
MAGDRRQQVEDQFAGAIDVQRIRVVVVGAGKGLEIEVILRGRGRGKGAQPPM